MLGKLNKIINQIQVIVMNNQIKKSLDFFINGEISEAKEIVAGFSFNFFNENNELTSFGLDEATYYPLPVGLKKILQLALLNNRIVAETDNELYKKYLITFDLVNKNNELTERGHCKAVEDIPLIKQCSEISLDYELINLSFNGKPELALLAYYQSLGFIGISSEGMGILMALKALMLDVLEKYNIFKSRQDSCTRLLTAQLLSIPDKSNEIISSISLVSRQKFITNFREIISTPYHNGDYSELSIEFIGAMYDSISTRTFISIAKKLLENPYLYGKGWPDLTLIKDNTVSFVEVKTTDKLHVSQLTTIPAMQAITPFSFSVCRIKNIE